MSQPNRFVSLKHASLARIDIPEEMTIRLTEVEAQICTLFDDCSKYLQAERGIDTSCRIAGGWVRDKLLGHQDSHDIDIALSDIMGFSFAEHLAAFAESKGIKTGTINKIAPNPDQSKHLETATFRFLGLDLDLVNLRSEEYAENSRIPSGIAFGTPLQDALRRDTTINSLFYNIHTRKVEDHTEKGLDDLRNGIIRTPLPPMETFRDDPLRVLRCVRFASRFGFEMVPEITKAAKDPTIQDAIIFKVARERVGEETSKMMTGRDPLGALRLIHDLSLYHIIFREPPEHKHLFSAPPAPHETALTAAYVLHRVLHPSESFPVPPIHPLLLSVVSTDRSCKAGLYLAAALTPYKGIAYDNGKPRRPTAIELIIRDSLKLGTQHHFLDGIPALFTAAGKELQNLTLDGFQAPSERVALGSLLRKPTVHNPNTGTHWTSSLLFSLVQELVPLYDIANDVLEVDAVVAIVERYNRLVRRIEELQLPETFDAKPLLNGGEIMKIFKSKAGPWVQKVSEKVVEWRLDNPKGTKEECTSWLEEQLRLDNISIEDVSSERASKKARTK